MTRFWQHALLFIIAAVVIGADQITKALIRTYLSYQASFPPVPPLADFFTLVHTTNTGAAFGMFQSGGGIFTIVAIVVVAAIIYYYRRIPEGQIAIRVALGLQLGGAIGNLVDRLIFGTVTDFIYFHWYNVLHAPIFNLADLSITTGVAILAWLMWRERAAEPSVEPPRTSVSPND